MRIASRLRPSPPAAPAAPSTPPDKPARPKRRAAVQLAGLESLVPDRPRLSVVILAHPALRSQVRPWLAEFEDRTVFVLSPDEVPEWQLENSSAEHVSVADLTMLGRKLRYLGAVDVIVDLLPDELLPIGATSQLDLFANVFRDLRKGGAYILDRRSAPGVSSIEGLTTWLQMLTAVDDPEAVKQLSWRDAEIAKAAGTVAVGRDLVVVTKRLRHFYKLSDSQVDRLLPAREPSITVTPLERRPGGEFESRATVVSHSPGFAEETMPSLVTYPELHLRRYEGKIALAGQTLMYTGHTILPDSFRWHLAANPDNPRLKSVSRKFARIESAHVPQRKLAGDYYQLDCAYPHHFGHLTTEVISRLWGWDTAKRDNPSLKAIFHIKPKSRKQPSLEKALFTAYGIAEDDIVWVNEPVWLSSVTSATPMWHNETPHYVHPDMVATWRRLGEALGRSAEDAPRPERIFVSRGPSLRHRACRNTDAVEAYFASRGFQVIYPETMPMAEQVVTFRHARVVAGFGGSAMFNLMHAQHLEGVILLNHEAYTARNEHLFTSLVGGQVHYFWSAPDVPHPDEGWNLDAFFSGWEFDFDRNGAELDEVLTQLG
ncbi:hypothetical protein NOCA2170003 [metagenome]|uniref:Glycosyltransferase 61 catalytic domain-containing protein n=1 Tax=metagenome TaxID=256318 RepID=A0A2P2BXE8_9ZZZZ